MMVVIAMSMITTNDAIVKHLSQVFGIGQIMFLRGLAICVIFALVLSVKRQPIFNRASFHRWNLLRGFLELLATLTFLTGLSMLPIATASTLEARVPFMHFFDGFRTTHEISKLEKLNEEDIREMIDEDFVQAHRLRALSPDHPVIRGTSQNPDVFFQSREAVNSYYIACPGIVQKAMDKFAQMTGRQYHLFDYHGAEDAERVIVIMGSGAEACHEMVDHLTDQGEKVGVLKVRLFRPLSIEKFIDALPKVCSNNEVTFSGVVVVAIEIR